MAIERSASASRLVRFGVFEFDLRSGDLRKAGARLNLPDQPLQFLTALLERPGELVTRDELRQRLWAEETFVDFEHGLNAAVKRLRDTLGDSADTPRFIETVPRRGYRFIAPVARDDAQPDPIDPPALEPVPERSPRRWRSGGLALLVLVVAVAVAYVFRPTLPPPQISNSMQITSDGHPKGGGGLFTDGARLYFNSAAGLSQVSMAGGQAAVMGTVGGWSRVLDISPDRSQLLVTGDIGTVVDRPIFVSPVLGGSLHRLDSVMAHDAAWSPDGRQLVYSQADGLYVAAADGTRSRQLATLQSPASWLRWSPDGKTIRFSIPTRAGVTGSIWQVSADGKGLHQLLVGWNDPASECCGVWAPDGKYFFFSSRKGGTGNIWAIREKGSAFYKVNHEPVQLSTGPAATFVPLPSIDGKKLFIVASRARGKLVHYDARTGEFLPYLNGISATCVDFSKDGQWIAYVQYPEYTLWRSKTDGSDKVQLTVSPMAVWMPRWSPDGAQIAFIGITPDQGMQGYLVTADGTGMPQLIPAVSGEAGEIDANWSPNGHSLVFSGVQSIFTANRSSRNAIHIMEMRTREVTTLPGSEGLFAPRWSPDGRYIAAMTNASLSLLVYELGAQKWVDLGTNVSMGWPQWSRDSQEIYVLGFPKDKPSAIFRVRLSDHRMEQLASLEHFRQALVGGAGNWMGMAPDNSPMLVEDVGTEDIYALDLKLP